MKKIVSMLLMVIMLVSAIPTYAEEGILENTLVNQSEAVAGDDVASEGDVIIDGDVIFADSVALGIDDEADDGDTVSEDGSGSVALEGDEGTVETPGETPIADDDNEAKEEPASATDDSVEGEDKDAAEDTQAGSGGDDGDAIEGKPAMFGILFLSPKDELIEQEITAEMYTDSTMKEEPEEDTAAITVKGMLPKDIRAVAWPVEAVESEYEMVSVYEVRLLLNGEEWTPEEELIVRFEDERIEAVQRAGWIFHAFYEKEELEIDEAEDLLERAGYCLSHSQKGNVILHFFIKHHIYDPFIAQEAVAHYGLKMPGS